jgi:chromosome segregation ATPase
MSINAPAVDIAARLNNLKSQIEKGKVEKTRAETNLALYTKQRDEIISQLTALGVTPEGLDAEIARLDQEIGENLVRAEELLRGQET